MTLKQFTLKEKKLIADNVFELTYTSLDKIEIIPGQFITFILPKIGGRAYSILETTGYETKLIIKRWSVDMGGRGGSMYICDLEVGETLNGAGPAGKFVLQENNKPKLFLGTGTGFVPLYNQILGMLKSPLLTKEGVRGSFIFGVRTKADLFYIKELEKLKQENLNFDFEIYLSGEDIEGFNKGYITNFLIPENTNKFKEFYICGAPAMIDSTIEKLKENGIDNENIFTEKY